MVETAGVLIKQGNEFVLQCRDNIPSIAEPGMIGIWGGAVEADDKTPEDAAIRELLEETGVKADINKLRKLLTYETTVLGPNNYGKPLLAHLFLLELQTDVIVECFEGLDVLRLKTIEQVPEKKRSRFLIKAIEAYEQTR
jgi:8-oxo-dGTP pyrophosphatase MutT (NUDIX family)